MSGAPIDRTKAPHRDDPFIAALTDEQVWALADVIARLAKSYADGLEAEGLTAALVGTHPRQADERRAAYIARLRAAGEAEQPSEGAPPPKPKRPPRATPSRLAKWEAAWQAEQDAEAES